MIPDSYWSSPIANLKFANWRIGMRTAPAQYITIHYNGPRVPAFGNPSGERDQLRFDATYHMRANVLGADGIQYHIAILSNGDKVLLRPLADKLWHCGNKRGNDHSIAIHIPIGADQQPTEKLLRALRETVNTLREAYQIHPTNLKPHFEWKPTQCPGIHLASFIGAYRSEAMHGTPFQLFITRDNANVRLRADVKSPVAYVLPINTTFAVSRMIEDGVPFNGSPSYVKLSDGTGFIHLSVVRAKGIMR